MNENYGWLFALLTQFGFVKSGVNLGSIFGFESNNFWFTPFVFFKLATLRFCDLRRSVIHFVFLQKYFPRAI